MMKREKEMAALLAGPCQMTAFFPEMLTPCGLCAMGFSCPHERNKRGNSDAWHRSYAPEGRKDGIPEKTSSTCKVSTLLKQNNNADAPTH